MKEDDIMKALARVARDQRPGPRLDARWDALSAGALSAEEIEALRTEAEQNEELQEAFEAFRPLDAGFRADVVERVRRQMQDQAAPAPPATESADTIAFPRRRRPVWMPAAMAAAIVSAVMVSFVLQPGVEPLPDYTTQLRGGATMRSAPEPTDRLPVFERGDRFELVLTPATTVEASLGVRLFRDDGEALEALAAPAAEVSPLGAARVVGRIGDDILLAPGPHEIVAVVGRADRLPGAAEVARKLGDDDVLRTRSWSATRIRLEAR